MESKSWVLFKRFLRGFAATAIPIAAAELAKGYDLSSLVDLKRFLLSLITPIIAGLLLAGEKAYRWEEPQQPVEIEDVPTTVLKGTKKSKA
jgi:hypothetical protein